MKFITPKLWALVFLFLAPFLTFAQKDVKKYKSEAEAIRKEVWEWDNPEFAVRTIPPGYLKASKVIIARHVEINADSKKKLILKGFGMYRELMLTEIARELVKINDKSALADYSEIAFTQIEKRSGFFIDRTTQVYVGVRVIKADGGVKEINADDIVLTKDEKQQKEAKLAIPDLEVGDIIDYFLAKQQSMEQLTTSTIADYTFALYDEFPIMNYSIHGEFGKKYAIEYRLYNGAPDFKNTTTDEDDNVLDLTKKNIPANTESTLWTSPYRQLPIIRMNIMIGHKGISAGRSNAREPGRVYKNQDAGEFVEDMRNAVVTDRKAILNSSGFGFAISSINWDQVLDLKKKKKNMALDSLFAEAYYMYRFALFLDPFRVYGGNMEAFMNLPSKNADKESIYKFGSMLREMDIHNELVLVTPHSGPELNEIMSIGDFDYLITAQSPKPFFFGISDIFSPAFYIPYEYEDINKAITLDTKGARGFNPKDFDQGFANTPGSHADQNVRIESLDVNVSPDAATLQVNRNTVLKGYYKSDVQKQLILYEDYYEEERKQFGLKKSVIEEVASDKKRKKFAEELKIALDQARSKQKDAFIAEAKEWFDQEITDLADYKIDNLGVRHTSPDFVYSSKFKMGGLIKRSGNNYIIDIGKLQGSPLQIKPDQRKRTLDIYMPFARSLQTQIILQIPDGYTVEGVNALNKKTENETGYFISEAASDGKKVTINIKKSYNKSFEPVSNWEKLLAFIDAANDWTNAKLLLKKK